MCMLLLLGRVAHIAYVSGIFLPGRVLSSFCRSVSRSARWKRACIVAKWLTRSRCCLWWWVTWVQGIIISWGPDPSTGTKKIGGNGAAQFGIDRAKMAEPVELPFGTVSRVFPRNCELGGRAHWHHLANTVEWLCAAAMNGSATMGGDTACY